VVVVVEPQLPVQGVLGVLVAVVAVRPMNLLRLLLE
jgi:hypothetical protein